MVMVMAMMVIMIVMVMVMLIYCALEAFPNNHSIRFNIVPRRERLEEKADFFE